MRHPVRFTDAVAQVIGEGHRIFLEVGPRAILQSYLADGLRSAEVQGRVLASLSRHQDDDDPFPAIAARCHAAGYDWTSSPSFDGPSDPRGLPLYPWKRDRFWYAVTTEAPELVNPPFDHPLLGFRQRGATASWLNHLDEEVVPWIADHAVEGMPVLPAAGILEMALAAARWRWSDAPALDVLDVELRRPMPFDKGRMRELRTVLQSEDGDWELSSRSRLSNEPLAVYAVARVSAATDARRILDWTEGAPVKRRIEGEKLYRFASLAGLDYGDRFRTVTHVEIADSDSAIAYLDPSPVSEDLGFYLLHPALLDGALQGLFGLLADRQHQMQGVGFLPWRFGRVRLLAPFGRVPRSARLRLTRIGVRSVSADIVLFDGAGDVVAELADCWFRRVELTRRRPIDERTLRADLVPVPLSEPGPPRELVDFPAILSRLAAAREPSQIRQEQALLLDALIASISFRSLEELVEPGRYFAVSELISSGRVAPYSVGIVDRLLRSLKRFGAASETELEWRLESSHDLPEVSEVWRLLLSEAPDLVAELALTATAAEELPRLLADGIRQPDGQLSPMAEQLLQGSPAIAPSIELLCDALAELAMAWPKAQPMRILELGASSGGATHRILNRLTPSGVALAYMAASTDSEQTARLSSLARSFSGVSACRWSPSDGNDGLNGAIFDIIIAINACARLRLDPASLAGLQDLLIPGGFFVALEAEPNALWDLVFGQNASWWQTASWADHSSPLRSGEDWRSDLAAAGFEFTDAITDASAPWPSALLWGCAPVRSEPVLDDPAEPTSVTLISGDGAFRAALQDRLVEAALRCHDRTIARFLPASAADSAPQPDDERQIVLFLAEEPGDDDPIEQVSQQITALARIATSVAERHAVLWVITCDAQQATLAHSAFSPVGGALWSLGRVLVNEMPRLSVRLLDLPGTATSGERAELVATELVAATVENEIVWTPQGRHVLRLRRGLPTLWATPSEMVSVGTAHIGGLDALGWEIRTPQPVEEGQVEIEVHAAGLNFRDVMWAMGLLPEEALSDGFAGPTLGLECAGIVRSLGRECRWLGCR